MGARLCAPDIPPKEDTVPNRTLDDVNPNPMIAEVRRVSHVASDLNDEAEYFIEILTQRCIDENLPPWKIDVQRRTTIAELKQKVAAESGEEPVTMQLYYEHIGRLRDELRLEDYGIEWGTRLYPIARPSKHLFCRCCWARCLGIKRNMHTPGGQLEVFVEEIEAIAKSGDIILFQNPPRCSTLLVRCCTASRWDHVGIVIETPTSRGSRKVLVEAVGAGVIATNLSKVLEHVPSGCAFYRELDRALEPEVEKELVKEVGRFLGRPYEADFRSMLRAVLMQDVEGWNNCCAYLSCCRCYQCGDSYDADLQPSTQRSQAEKQLDRVFCSELVAHLYQSAGLLSNEHYAESYLPKDFSSEHNSNIKYLEQDFALLYELRIVKRDDENRRHHYHDAVHRQERCIYVTKKLEEIKEKFENNLDENADGIVTRGEWITAFGNDDFFDAYDSNHDGTIDTDEFVMGATMKLGPSLCLDTIFEGSCEERDSY